VVREDREDETGGCGRVRLGNSLKNRHLKNHVCDVMDTNMMSGFGVALSVLSVIFIAVNHKRCKSMCCGRTASVSFDVDSTTPQPSPQRLPLPSQPVLPP